MSQEPDDPSNPRKRLPPPLAQDRDRDHIKRTYDALKSELDRFGHMRDVFKTFMVYAWCAESDLSPQDVILVETRIDDTRRGWFFAEKLPGDERFRAKYQAMTRIVEEVKAEMMKLSHKIEVLTQERDDLLRKQRR